MLYIISFTKYKDKKKRQEENIYKRSNSIQIIIYTTPLCYPPDFEY